MPSPLHAQLTQSLLNEIASRPLVEEKRFLSNRQIARLWEVNQWTVDRSIQFLKEKGILAARPRSGYRLTSDAPLKAMIYAQLHDVPPLEKAPHWQQRVRKLIRPTSGNKHFVILFDSPRLWFQAADDPHVTAPSSPVPPHPLWESFCEVAREYGDRLDRLELPAQSLTQTVLDAYLRRHRWDGAFFVRRICYPQAFEVAMKYFERISFPCVSVLDHPQTAAHGCVTINYAGMGYEGILTLRQLGVQRVILVDNLKGFSNSRTLRLKGALLALEDTPSLEKRVFQISHEKQDEVPQGLLNLLEEARAIPTGMMVFNRQLFHKIEAAMQARGLRKRLPLSTISSEHPLPPSALHENTLMMAFHYPTIAREAYHTLCAMMEGATPSMTLLKARLTGR